MKDSIQRKLEGLAERHEEVGHLLSDPGTMSDQNKFRELSKEYSQLEEVVVEFNNYLQIVEDIQ